MGKELKELIKPGMSLAAYARWTAVVAQAAQRERQGIYESFDPDRLQGPASEPKSKFRSGSIEFQQRTI